MQLTYSGQSSKDRGGQTLAILCAVLLGASSFMAGCSAFGLRWSPAQAFRGNPLQGLLSVCNSIADRLGATDYIILRKFAGGTAADGSALPQGMFLTIALVLLCVLSYLILRSGCRWLLLIFAVPAAALLLLTETAPGVWSALALGFALVCALVCMMSDRQERQERFSGGGSILLLAIPALALVITLAASLAIDQTTGFAQNSLQIAARTAIQGHMDKRYGENPLGKGDLGSLTGEELAKLRGTSEEALRQLTAGGSDATKTALQIRMDPANGAHQPLWLRGFVGETYRDHRWARMDNETYYNRRDAQYWLNKKGFDGLSQLSETAQLSDPLKAGEAFPVTIETEKADRSCIYIPYEMTGTDTAIPRGTQNYAGGFLRTDRIAGTKTADYLALPDMTGTWTDWVGRLYSTKSSPALQEYYTNESHYNIWCYEHYTDVPEDLAGALYVAVGDPGDLTKDHADYQQTIRKVQEYLDGSFIYSENFKPSKEGEDPIENFLKTGKGCDAHYASLAAMLMRYHGIPARYVEGYVFTPADASAAEAGQPYDIGFSHAHAWTEIYIDGFGWVPMEFTPAWREVMPQADLSRGLEAVAYESKKSEMTDTPAEEIMEPDTPEYGRLMTRILKVAGIILLILLLSWILQRLVRRAWAAYQLKRSFADPDPRRGICAMYGYMLEKGIPLTENADAMGLRAAYSELPVCEDERNAMRQELEWGKNEKKKQDKMDRGSLSDRAATGLGRLRRK